MSDSAKHAAFLRRKRIPVLVGVDELVALLRRQVAHAPDRPVDSFTAVGGQLLELLKQLACPLFLIGSQVLPGFHAIEHALLLLGRQVGKMLQLPLQTLLLLRRKLAELPVVFQFAVLLFGRQISIAAEPIPSVASLILLRTSFAGAALTGASLIGTTLVWTRFFLQLALAFLLTLLLFLTLLLLMRPPLRLRAPRLGEGRRQQQKRCQTAHNFGPSQHVLVLVRFANLTDSRPRRPEIGRASCRERV